MRTIESKRKRLAALGVGLALGLVAGKAAAFNLAKSDDGELNFDVETMLAAFSSQHSYAFLRSEEESVRWQEGYLKAGFGGKRMVGNGEIFGAANVLASFTSGDGDAAGFTTGDESEVDFEDLYAGWRNEHFEVSAGSQRLVIGDGWLINGDALNFGKGFGVIPDAPDFDRGGAYWLAARKAYRQTLVLRAGGDTGLRGDVFYLKSNNPAQVKTALAGVNVEYVADVGTFGAYYLKGLDVDQRLAEFLGFSHRDGQNTFSVRYQGNAGVENLFLSGEFTTQHQGNDTRKDADAWYLEGGWTFADTRWKPSVNLRVGEFGDGYDPLFYGFNRGYGTWFQGEVAANYAGPLNTNAEFKHLGVKAAPTETLTLGANYFRFDGKSNASVDAQELDLYAEWWVRENIMVSPVLGFYDPDEPASNGGMQIGSGTNTYAQVFVLMLF